MLPRNSSLYLVTNGHGFSYSKFKWQEIFCFVETNQARDNIMIVLTPKYCLESLDEPYFFPRIVCGDITVPHLNKSHGERIMEELGRYLPIFDNIEYYLFRSFVSDTATTKETCLFYISTFPYWTFYKHFESKLAGLMGGVTKNKKETCVVNYFPCIMPIQNVCYYLICEFIIEN